MRITYLILFLVFSPFIIEAQTYFNKTYGFPYPFIDATYSPVIEIPGEGYLFIWNSWDVPNDNTSFYIAKTDFKGDTLFTKHIIHKPGKGYGFWAQYMNKVSDGNLIITGINRDFVSDSLGKIDYILIKITPSGDTLWLKSFSSGALKNIASMVVETVDKGFLIVGISVKYVGINASPPDVFVVKTDSLGNLLWKNEYGSGNDDRALSCTGTSDEGFLIAGYTRDASGNNSDIYLLKIDSVGIFQWQKMYGTSFEEAANSIIRLRDDNYLVAGEVNYNSPNPNNGQAILLKIKSDGTQLWQKKYGGPEFTTLNSVIELNDSSIVAAGGSNNTSLKSQAGWIIKTNSSGDSIWARIHDYNDLDLDLFYGISRTQDKGYIMSGFAHNKPPADNSSDVWIMKVDSLGCGIMGCQYVGLPKKLMSNIELNVFPNPTNGKVTIELTEGEISFAGITDISGMSVSSLSFMNCKAFVLDLNEWRAGIYFLKIINNRGESVIKRIIKE